MYSKKSLKIMVALILSTISLFNLIFFLTPADKMDLVAIFDVNLSSNLIIGISGNFLFKFFINFIISLSICDHNQYLYILT